jgi:hypothetical protein
MTARDIVAGAVGVGDVQRDGVLRPGLRQVKHLDAVIVVELAAVGRIDEAEIHRSFLVLVYIVVVEV